MKRRKKRERFQFRIPASRKQKIEPNPTHNQPKLNRSCLKTNYLDLVNHMISDGMVVAVGAW